MRSPSPLIPLIRTSRTSSAGSLACGAAELACLFEVAGAANSALSREMFEKDVLKASSDPSSDSARAFICR
jgi:hypothetical protein